MPQGLIPQVSADTTRVTADTTAVTADRVGRRAPPGGWPCAILATEPPSVADKQSNPTADDLLPAILALTPRGPAWGTDEAGDGQGASPVQRLFWRAIAAFVADVNARDFEVATQAFPSAATIALNDWEEELGLPDACLASQNSLAGRLAAVRARFGGLGGQSRDYLICLAAACGYAITIEEPTQFLVDVSECCDGGVLESYFTIDEGECDGTPLESFELHAPALALGDEVAGGIIESYFTIDEGECDGTPLESFEDDPAGTVWKYWIVHVRSLGETWFRCDEGEIDFDPLEGFLTAADLECVLRRACPPHTQVVFAYDAA